jgi:TPR repeat protein
MIDDIIANEGRFARACRLYDEGHYKLAFEEFLALAEHGDTSAMTRIALMYDAGEGVSRDVEESIKWDMKAAELGDVTGLINLGISYRNRGDVRRARKWLEEALQAGDGEAALELAKMYLVSDLETDRVRAYLGIVLQSDSICESSRDEAEQLLEELQKS